MRFTLGLLCALCAFAGAFAARPIDLSQEEKFESLVPVVEEHSELTDFAQSTRSLLQTYPPPSPVNEVGDNDTPLGGEEDEDDRPVVLQNQVPIGGNNATEREAVANDIINQIGPDGTLSLRKSGGRRLMNGRSMAEKMLQDALNAADLATSGSISFSSATNDAGEVIGLDITITLFYPSDVSDADRQANAENGGSAVVSNSENYQNDFQNAVAEAAQRQNLSSDVTEANSGNLSFTNTAFTATVTDSASAVKTGLLSLFVSVAAVLLLA